MRLFSNSVLPALAAAFAAAVGFGAAAQRQPDVHASPPETSANAPEADTNRRPGEGDDSPQAAIEHLWSALESASSAAAVDERYRRLDPVVTATHDLPYIAELTIRREWASLSSEQKERFIAAFERLSVMTYASRFAALKPDMFKVTESRQVGDDRAQVEATLTTPKGEMIPFEYLLHETPSGWKIINILADNVSDLALKRAEYREVLDKGSIDDLIKHIEQQADEAARGGEVKARP
jgi:phospholipid transport system substrate-binding protein